MKSEGYRLRGNEEFKAGNFANAVEQYSKAIDVDPGNKTLFSNRSAAYFQLENYIEAMKDAQRCTELDPSFAKGYFRLGCAFEKLDRKHEALESFQKALDISPHDQSIVKKTALLKKELRNQPQVPSSSFQQRSSSGGAGGNRQSVRVPAKNSWAIGLSPDEQHEWLIDCYRMRVDDMMHYGMGTLGLYMPDVEAKDIVEDFLVFCKMALRNEIIPDGWDWKAFLEAAKVLLAYAFEKSDAKDKYGGENIFSAMLGGRSLRFTAEMVYESSCISSEGTSQNEVKIRDFLAMGLDALFRSEPGFFEDIGGVAAWRNLEEQVEQELNSESFQRHYF